MAPDRRDRRDRRAREAEGDTLLVTVEGLSVTLGGRPILTDIHLAIRAGEIVTLIGPNGAGKTTLARAILGLVKPDRGAARRRPGLIVGYLPQRVSIDPTLPLTVGRFLTLPKRRPRPALEAALDEVGATHLLERQVHDLSGGELQRVLLARALLREPDLLVLDEPAQGIDFAGQLELFQLIHALRERRRCAVLMISHDLHLVMAATDRVVCLNHHVCCQGEPEAVTRNPEYLALFGPAAARAVAVYSHEHDHAHDIAGQVVSADHDHEQSAGTGKQEGESP